ncbi:DUF1648 domain-containing protein [Clostridium hydrogenum]|uniref:DUF1648 domain-containing protein n=1 Tax=Clostridium hydrogenum TaxID=2855764 RepID=UPI001F4183C7|nr:DUF1648 domain-containing protein [Clostridium hydrogenum]
MNENLYNSCLSAFIMLILIISQIIYLNVSRSDIFLGVRIPESERRSYEIRDIGKKYICANLFIGIPVMIVFSIIIYNSKNPYIIDYVLFPFMAMDFLIFYVHKRMVSRLKKEKGWLKTKKQIVVVDTNFSKEKAKKYMPSSMWFIPSILLIVICIIMNFYALDKLPNRYPSHWNAAGRVDGYSNKSYLSVLMMPIFQLIMLIAMFFSFKIIGWSRQEISASDPEGSKKRNIKFRKIWATYIIISNYITQFIFITLDLTIMKIIKFNNNDFLAFYLVIYFIITIVSITLSIKVGQGGSRLKIEGCKAEHEIPVRDDDKFWKLGMIYYNKNDPAIFVEKRVGIGWTINAGSKVGISIYIFIIIVVICSLIPAILKL